MVAPTNLIAPKGAFTRAHRWWLSPELGIPLAFLLALVAFLMIPMIHSVPSPIGGNVLETNEPVLSRGHLLGTDLNGNDLASCLIYGGRTSLFIALIANALGLMAGGALGTVSGYFGGILDAVLMRIMDVLIAFPSLILVLVVAQALGPGEIQTTFALSFFSIPAFARLARAGALGVKERQFVLAARFSGLGTRRILVRHVLPHIVPQLAIFAMLGVGALINIEAAVSFLGLGVPLPEPSWGGLINQGQMALGVAPSLVLLPGGLLFISVLAFNLLGETLRTRWAKQ
jgi:peptide/nickel transport system permease protein